MTVLIEKGIYLGLAYSFRGLVHCYHAREHWQYTGRHGAGEAAESSTYKSSGSRKRKTLGLSWAFETSKLTYSNRLPTRPHLLILPNSATSWRLSIQTYEPGWRWGSILIQSTALSHIGNKLRWILTPNFISCFCLVWGSKPTFRPSSHLNLI